MKRLIATIAMIALVVGVVLATPASAGDQKPLSGKMELTLFEVPCEAGFLTWAGTVVIDGTTYGWADFLTGFSVDGKFIYFEEDWTIFRLNGNEPVTPEIACEADRVVLAGVNEGWGPPGFTGKADGTVTYAPEGPFDDVALNSRMFWRGKVTAPTEFKATLHIQPTR